MKWAVIALVLLLLVIAGCVAIVGVGTKEAVDELERQQNENAITQAEFRSVQLGTTQDAVEQRFGEPQDKQEFESEGIEGLTEPSNSSCIYYNRRAGDLGDIFQFCFENGRLTSKNSY